MAPPPPMLNRVLVLVLNFKKEDISKIMLSKKNMVLRAKKNSNKGLKCYNLDLKRRSLRGNI